MGEGEGVCEGLGEGGGEDEGVGQGVGEALGEGRLGNGCSAMCFQLLSEWLFCRPTKLPPHGLLDRSLVTVKCTCVNGADACASVPPSPPTMLWGWYLAW